jgi:DNA ligase-associated metallophosphoesterase
MRAGTPHAEDAPHLRIGRLDCRLDPSGALFVPAERLLIVADLHLEKGSSGARRGCLLPPYDTRDTLAVLATVIARLDPRRVVALGDSFHDRAASARLGSQELASLAALQRGRDWIWIAGNHDPDPPQGVAGAVTAEIALGDVALRHEPRPGESGPEIAGHLHPAGKVRLHGRAVRRRCFASDNTRCVMPAFGAFAGGLNVLDAAFRPFFAPRDLTAYVLGLDRVYAIRAPMLVQD